MAKKARHVPQRTCVGCRQTKAKNELMRVVRQPDGHIQLDPSGRISGRGAYVCADSSCLQSALKGNRLERALGRPVTDDVARSLAEQLNK